MKYIVEAKPSDSDLEDDWMEMADTPDCQCSIYDLETGKDLQFRIRAVNEAGVGNPSYASKNTKIELPKSWLIPYHWCSFLFLTILVC